MSLPVPFSPADTLSRLYLAVPASAVAATRDASLRYFDRRVRDAGPCEVGCSDCGGSGQGRGGEHSTCRTCHGAGVVTSQVWS